ncbi:hypothetical protein ONS95_008801 [Cadophora gregata]|uniref:uncharacterized protein n=1 Tax=Cadophora gregata TaxID=51156 RepID=UPI0026DAA1AA|nr:uncharacterized protein ONS95_008801 [Cadophora gregata]KAK0123800.1 hypothetical protein ONS95_008801 [Cadophora gregata]
MHIWSSNTLLSYLRTLPLSTIERVDSDGRTLLQHAIDQKNNAVVDILLEKQPDINREDKLGRSYLSHAIRTLNVTAAQKLIDFGAEIENSCYMDLPLSCLSAPNPRNTFFHHAIYAGNDSTISFLLSLGAPVSTVDAKNNTPLMLAIQSGSDAITNLLLDSLPSSASALAILAKNTDSETPLHFLSDRTPHLSPSTIQRLVSLTLSFGGSSEISHP